MDPNVPEAAQPNIYNAPALAEGQPLLTTPLHKAIFFGGLAICFVIFFLIGFRVI